MSDQNRQHPEVDTLRAFGLGMLDPPESTEVEQHVVECPECCQTLLSLGEDTFVALVRQSGPEPRPGETIDSLAPSSGRAAELPPALADHPRYRIVRLVGRGGMGDVYQAEHRLMHRPVAIKVISRRLVANAAAVERFHREVQAAAKLSHPNIVTAHDAEQAGDVHFLVMEYVEGTDLAEVVKQRGPLSVEQACDYVRQAAAGLQHAHEQGMVHRDIKPHNLMLTADGKIKILDFGLANFATSSAAAESPSAVVHEEADAAVSQLTTLGTMMGTPDFIAPEQADDAHAADIRADLYSLGCTLYFLLAGNPPFPQGDVMHKLAAHRREFPEPIENVRVDVPPELAEVLRRLLAKSPAERFQTPAEVADALAPFVERHRSDQRELLADFRPVTLHVRATRTGRVVSWFALNRGELIDASRLAYFFFTVTLPDVITDLIEHCRALDPQCRIDTIMPTSSTSAALDLAIVGNGFRVVCARRLVRGGFPLNPLAAEFGGNYDVVVTIDTNQPQIREQLVALLQRKYSCRVIDHVLPATPQSFPPREAKPAAEPSPGSQRAMPMPSLYVHLVRLIVVWLAGTAVGAGIVLVRRLTNLHHDWDDLSGTVLMSFLYLMIGVSYLRIALPRAWWGMQLELAAAGLACGLAYFPMYGAFHNDTLGPMIGLWLVAAVVNSVLLLVVQWAWPPRAHTNASVSDATDARPAAGRLPAFVASTLLGALIALGVVVFVVTDQGTLVIESVDDSVEIEITRPRSDTDKGLTVRIVDRVTGSQVVRLPSGHYRLMLGERGNEFWLTKEQFVLRRGEKVVVRLVQRPTATTSSGQKAFTEIRRLVGHKNNIDALAYSRDGKYLFAGSGDKLLYQWDVAAGRIVRKIPVGDFPWAIAVHPDGRHVISSQYGGSITLWSLESGRAMRQFAGHTRAVMALAISPDGKRLLSGGQDGLVRLWDVETGEPIRSFQESYCDAVAMTSDGRLAAHGATGSGFRIWHLETGESLHEIGRGGAAVSAAAFSPDGTVLVTGDGYGLIQVWDVKTGKEIHHFDAHTSYVTSLVFLPGGRFFVSGSYDKTMRLFDLARGKEIAHVKSATLCVSHLAIAPDGRTLASGGGKRVQKVDGQWQPVKDGDYDIRLWRLPESVALAPPSVRLFTISPAGELVRIDVAGSSFTSAVVKKMGVELHSAEGLAMADGVLYAAVNQASGDSRLYAIDADTGEAALRGSLGVRQVDGLAWLGGELFGVTSRFDGKSLDGADAGRLLAIDPQTAKTQRIGGDLPLDDLDSLTFGPSGRLITTDGMKRLDQFYELDPRRDVPPAPPEPLAPTPPVTTDRDIEGLTLAADGMLYGVTHPATNKDKVSYLVRIDPHTFDYENLGQLTFGVLCLTADLRPPQAIRTQSELQGGADSPPAAVAPFAAVQAAQLQDAWSKHLGVPVEHTNSLGMKFRLIPPGEFEMGSSDEVLAQLQPRDDWFFSKWTSDRRRGEMPRHRVRITRPFYLAAHEITVGQFREFVKLSGYRTAAETSSLGGSGYVAGDWQQGKMFNWMNPGFTQDDNHPVCNLDWNDAAAYCRWLSEQEQAECRLPTEAEWEYACRAGTTTLFSSGGEVSSLAGAANLADRSLAEGAPGVAWTADWNDEHPFTAPVGSFQPNAFGLFDMHGNAAEWCGDWYDADYYAQSPADDPAGPAGGEVHVFRGGAFDNWAGFARSADRYSSHSPTLRTDWAGLRVVLPVEAGRKRLAGGAQD